jgi:hypothetical protein
MISEALPSGGASYFHAMPLFQSAVLKKYLKQQDGARIAAAYAAFTKPTSTTRRQQNILNAKEEQFQEGFLRELFVKVLGYTLNPQTRTSTSPASSRTRRAARRPMAPSCRTARHWP